MTGPDSGSRRHGDPARRLALVVDLGTGGPKVGIATLDGRLLWSGARSTPTRREPDGMAVQDAGAWWTGVRELARVGLACGVVDPSAVEVVAVTGQWGSTVPVDAAGMPVGDCRLYLDTRGARHTRTVIGGPVLGYHPGRALTWLRRTAGAPSPGGGDPVGHMLAFQRDEPEVAAAARWFLEPVDYLTMRFTGRAVASHSTMTLAWLTDNRDQRHLAYDERLVALSGVDGTKLPPLVATGSVVGTVAPDVAADLGLRPDAQVIAGTTDLVTATVGSGATGDHQAHFAVSTTTWISCPVPDKKTDVLHSIATVPGLRPDRYLLANNHETAGLCLQWAKDEVFGGSFDELTALAATSPPGAGGVVFTPWLSGLRSPIDDRLARGGWHNMSLRTTRADLVRALLEGVACNTRWLHEHVEKFVGQRLDPVRFIGGGAVSDLWCQVHADIMGRRVERVAEPMTAQLRGAALVAGMAVGALTVGEAADAVRVERTFVPDEGARAAYEPIYAQFRTLYRRQKGLFAALNR
jgi:xylulokinase